MNSNSSSDFSNGTFGTNTSQTTDISFLNPMNGEEMMDQTIDLLEYLDERGGDDTLREYILRLDTEIVDETGLGLMADRMGILIVTDTSTLAYEDFIEKLMNIIDYLGHYSNTIIPQLGMGIRDIINIDRTPFKEMLQQIDVEFTEDVYSNRLLLIAEAIATQEGRLNNVYI